MNQPKIITVDMDNADERGLFCVKNKKHPGYIAKRRWLSDRFAEGLKIKIALDDSGAQAGFIEYTPGEYTWRIINAPGYLVIHCVLVMAKKFAGAGYASALIKDCLKDARAQSKKGVAVMTSDGSWMAGKELFHKNGFEQVDKADPAFQLLVKRFADGQLPAFPSDWHQRLKPLRGLQLLYSNQCPFIGKAVEELPPVAQKYGAELNLVRFDNPAEARKKMPSPYGMFNLVNDGVLLADHPISATRFGNILRKDLKLSSRA